MLAKINNRTKYQLHPSWNIATHNCVCVVEDESQSLWFWSTFSGDILSMSLVSIQCPVLQILLLLIGNEENVLIAWHFSKNNSMPAITSFELFWRKAYTMIYFVDFTGRYGDQKSSDRKLKSLIGTWVELAYKENQGLKNACYEQIVRWTASCIKHMRILTSLW